ncbi:hypothetical protein [Streptosporangium sp. CA-115845]|uniref:hypothetical protein n=1 Tax=Streptosporangium sp. CA-115845 TaxID=3240071 RepID=UPI003D8EC968
MHRHGHRVRVLSRNGTNATGSTWWAAALRVRRPRGARALLRPIGDGPAGSRRALRPPRAAGTWCRRRSSRCR